MQNGNLQPSHRNIIIQSIKPKRPLYPSHQKEVPVKEALKEWDKLDAYYRGQLLQFNAKTPKKSTKKKTKERHPSVKHDGVDLFGDENSFYQDIDEISIKSDLKTYDDDWDYREETKEKYLGDHREKDKENYLAVSKEDFTIKLDMTNKKRSWQKAESRKMLGPISTCSYNPPVAAGLNTVHIQKILYHKCIIPSPSDGGGSSSDNFSTLSEFPRAKDSKNEKDNTNTTKLANKQSVPPKLKNSAVSNTNDNVSVVPPASSLKSGKANGNNSLSRHSDSYPPIRHKQTVNNKPPCDIRDSNEQLKRKSETESNNKKTNRKMDSESPVPVSSTSELFEKQPSPPKKQKLTDHERKNNDVCANKKRTESGSLVNSIVNKSIQSLLSVNTKDIEYREKQRELESIRRKSYALKKVQEQEELESIELAFKSFELILDFPPLSPIRSPVRSLGGHKKVLK